MTTVIESDEAALNIDRLICQKKILWISVGPYVWCTN